MGASQQNKTRACSCVITSGLRYIDMHSTFICWALPAPLPVFFNRFGCRKWLNVYQSGYVGKWQIPQSAQLNEENCFFVVKCFRQLKLTLYPFYCCSGWSLTSKPPWPKPDNAIRCASCASPATAFAAPWVLSVGAMECWEVLARSGDVTSKIWGILQPGRQLNFFGEQLGVVNPRILPAKAPTVSIPFAVIPTRLPGGSQDISVHGTTVMDGAGGRHMWRLNDPCRSTILPRSV